jgi:hypothetical protein
MLVLSMIVEARISASSERAEPSMRATSISARKASAWAPLPAAYRAVAARTSCSASARCSSRIRADSRSSASM